jgi:hypothetical protein
VTTEPVVDEPVPDSDATAVDTPPDTSAGQQLDSASGDAGLALTGAE